MFFFFFFFVARNFDTNVGPALVWISNSTTVGVGKKRRVCVQVLLLNLTSVIITTGPAFY